MFQLETDLNDNLLKLLNANPEFHFVGCAVRTEKLSFDKLGLSMFVQS